MITKLYSSEGGAKIGIVKALSKITKQRLGVNPSAWENWYYKNKDRLENMDISNKNNQHCCNCYHKRITTIPLWTKDTSNTGMDNVPREIKDDL